MKNALVVFNYNAGRKKAILHKKIIHKFLLKRCSLFKFVSIDELDNTDLNGYDTIFAVGGDGTVNKVARIIAGTDMTLAVIPCGTANLLAAKLGIPSNLKKALKIIDKNHIKIIDALNINNLPSFLRCGFGYDSDIICKTPQSIKNDFGYFAYFLAGIIFALKLNPRPYDINVAGRDIKINASCVIVANSANMYRNWVSVGRKNELDDGLMDVFVLNTKNPVSFFIEFLKILLNIKFNTKKTKYFKTDKLVIKNTWVACHIDGEKMKLKNDINISVIPQILNVYSK